MSGDNGEIITGEDKPSSPRISTIFFAEKIGDNVNVRLGVDGFAMGDLMLAKEILDLEVKKLLANKLYEMNKPKIQVPVKGQFLNNIRKGLHKR